MPHRRFALCFLSVLTAFCLFLSSNAQAQSGVTIINEDWESPLHIPFGYAGINSTVTQTNQAGAGVGGSRGAVLNATLGFFGGAGILTDTTANPNTTISDENQIVISFNARVRTSFSADALFYVHTWPGVYNGPIGSDGQPVPDGTRFVGFKPTHTFQTFTFNLGAMPGTRIIPNHQTMQLGWQIDNASYPQGNHIIEIDNVRVVVVPLSPLLSITPVNAAFYTFFPIGGFGPPGWTLVQPITVNNDGNAPAYDIRITNATYGIPNPPLSTDGAVLLSGFVFPHYDFVSPLNPISVLLGLVPLPAQKRTNVDLAFFFPYPFFTTRHFFQADEM